MFSIRGPKVKYFAAVLAVIALIAGVYFTFFQSRGFVETKATIIDIVEDSIGEETTYYPIVEYTVNGDTYSGQSDQSCSPDAIGKTISILYNPEDPLVFHGNGQMGIYLMIVGAVILVIVVVSEIIGRKNMKETSQFQKSVGKTEYAPHVEGEERELYFLTDLGTEKYGHRIEDKNRKILYEAKMTKFSLTTAYKYDFIDHVHGTTVPHLIGHEEESQWGSLLVDDHYTFEFDGVDVWKHLKENGIKVDTGYTAGEATLVGMKYHIYRDGVEIALAETTSQYPHEEDAAQHKVAGAIPIEGFYRIWTKEQNLDLLFVTLMAFARSKAADDKGGTRGAMFGTIKNMSAQK